MRQPFLIFYIWKPVKKTFISITTTFNPSRTNFVNACLPAGRQDQSRGVLVEVCMRASKMKGYGFRRQRPVLNYIADFICQELLLIIEVDGITRQDEHVISNGKICQTRLESAGFTVIRFTDDEVLKNMKDVISTLDDLD
jgi:very-short-patch-repair endonuclease